MNDTPLDVEKKMAEMMSKKTPADRLRMAGSMFDCAKKLMMAGFRMENKKYTPGQLRTKLFLRLYGDCFTDSEKEKIIAALPNMEPIID